MAAYDIVNLRLGLAGESLQTTLIVNNLFDEKGVLTRADSIIGHFTTRIAPRTIGVSAQWRY